jgi:hypothetical protein
MILFQKTQTLETGMSKETEILHQLVESGWLQLSADIVKKMTAFTTLT